MLFSLYYGLNFFYFKPLPATSILLSVPVFGFLKWDPCILPLQQPTKIIPTSKKD